MFYHIKNLQSTKTLTAYYTMIQWFYHIKNLQSTKTSTDVTAGHNKFYHIKNLQSTKTIFAACIGLFCFITLRIYKVLKLTATVR